MSCDVQFNLPGEETEALLRGRDLLKDQSTDMQSSILALGLAPKPGSPFVHWGFSVWLMKLRAQALQRERRLSAGEVWSEAEMMGSMICLQAPLLGSESEDMSSRLT